MAFTPRWTCWVGLISAMCLGCISRNASAALTDDLVVLLQFEDNYNDTSGSANANNGSPVGAPSFATGRVGQAVSFTDVTDYVTLGRPSDMDFGDTVVGDETDFSIGFWMYQNDNVSDPAVFSNKDWDSGSNTGLVYSPKGTGIFDLNTKGDTGSRQDLDGAGNSASTGVGQWSYVLTTFDRDGVTSMYINGAKTGTVATSQGSFNTETGGPPPTGGLDWNIGQDGAGDYGINYNGLVDELTVWRRIVTDDEASQLYNFGAGLDILNPPTTDPFLKVVIDRDSGQVSLMNNTGAAQQIKGYAILSAAGTLSEDAATFLADSDPDWVKFTADGAVSDLSEGYLATDTFSSGESFDLGAAWTPYFNEDDITFEYLDGAGALVQGVVEFTGSSQATPFAEGDLDFDGDVDGKDWLTYAAQLGSSFDGLSVAQAYRVGDFNGDGVNNHADFVAFQTLFDTANGAGAFAAYVAGQAVPEPSSIILLACVALGIVGIRGRRS